MDTLPPPGRGSFLELIPSGEISTFSLLPLILQNIMLLGVETLHMYSCFSSIVTIKTGGEGTVMNSEKNA